MPSLPLAPLPPLWLGCPMNFDFSKNPENFVEALARFDAYEVPAIEVYSDIFRLGEGFIQRENELSGLHKANPIILGEFSGKMKRRILFEDTFEETLREFQQADWAITNGLTYWGRENSANNQSKMCAMIFDLDGVTPVKLQNYLYGVYNMKYDFYPAPQYVILSGHGVHLYFVFDEPIDLYPNIKTQLKDLKYHLTDRIWNPYTSEDEQVQHQGINQGFRVIGGKTKDGGVVRAFRVEPHPTTIEILNEFVHDEHQVDVKKRYRASKYTLEEAKKRWPDWYESVVVGGGQCLHAWPVKIDLYNWWLRKMQTEVVARHRYFSLMALAIFAVKCGITDRDKVKKDMESLIPHYRELDTEEDKKPFGDDGEIENALECFDLRYVTFPRKDIERLTAVSMPPNKRNGRRQEVHLRGARAIQQINDEANGTNWRNTNGAPKKRDLIRDYASKYPEATQREIANALHVSPTTVNKWLKQGNLEK